MKKIVSLVCCIVIALTMVIVGNASESPQNRIYAERINAISGETVSIPIKISNNTGFMGFAIFVHYDPEVFTPVSTEGSDMLSGLVNDSIGTSQNGVFKIVYTGTDNVTGEGELVTVVFRTASEIYGEKSISITYSEDDTFDEKWNPVELSPEDIIIEFPEKPVTEPEEPPVDPDQQEENEKFSVRISNRIAGLKAPFNKILKMLLSPLIWIISLFEKGGAV